MLGLNLVSGSAALLLLLSNIYSTLTDSSNVYPVHLLIDTNTGHTPSTAAAVAVAVWGGWGQVGGLSDTSILRAGGCEDSAEKEREIVVFGEEKAFTFI